MVQVFSLITVISSLIVSTMALLGTMITYRSKNDKVVDFFISKKYFIATGIFGVIGVISLFAALLTMCFR